MTSLLLPSEILDLVASYLFNDNSRSKAEDGCLLTVCKHWYTAFQPSFYRKVQIRSRQQLNKLMSTIERNENLKIYVRHLYIGDKVGLSREQLQSLPFLFPLLESLYFNPKLWKYQHASVTTDHSTWDRLESLPPLDQYKISLPLIKTIGSSLKSLTLKGGMVNSLHQQQEPSQLLDLLKWTPQLKSVKIYGRDKENATTIQSSQRTVFSLSNVLQMHAVLPCLESLELLDIVLSISPLEQDQAPIIAPVAQMQRFRVEGVVEDYHWLNCIAELYPSLKELNLDLRWDASYRQTFTLADIHAIQENLNHIADKCRLLRKVSLGNLPSVLKSVSTADGGFFGHLAKVTHLAEVNGICKDRNLTGTAAFNHFQSVMACTHPSITKKVQVQLWRDLGAISNVMVRIGACKELKDLELYGGKFSYSWMYGCDIDVILARCPQLETLTLSTTRLTVASKDESLKILSNVKTVRLIHTHFTTEAMNALARYCPQLEHLELIHCVKEKDALENKIHLNFSHQHLKTLTIQHLHLRPSRYIEKSSIDAALVAVRYSERIQHNLARKSYQPGQRWYHLYSQRYRKHNKHSRQIRRLQLLEVLQVLEYTMTSKDWDYLEENSVRGTYRESKYWESDIPYGYVQIDCKNIDTFVFNRVQL